MIDYKLALELEKLGLRWEPEEGDLYIIRETFVGTTSDYIPAPMMFTRASRIDFTLSVKDKCLWLPQAEDLLELLRKAAEEVDVAMFNDYFDRPVVLVTALWGKRGWAQTGGETLVNAVAQALMIVMEKKGRAAA